MKDKRISYIFFGTYLISFILVIFQNLYRYNKYLNIIKKLIDNDVKRTILLILFGVLFAIVTFVLNYLIIKYIGNFITKSNYETIGNIILLSESILYSFSLLLGETPLYQLTVYLPFVIYPIVYGWLMKDEYQLKDILFVVVTKYLIVLLGMVTRGS